MANVKRTREDILVAVLELVSHRGFQATGLKELFAASQASSGSFYNYFQSKDELGHALIDFQWEKVKANILEAAIATTEDPIAQVFNVIDRLEANHLREINCAGCLLGNLIVDLSEYNPTFREHLTQVFTEWQSALADMLARGRNQLQPHIDPTYLAEQLLTAIEGVLLMARLYNEPERMQRGFNTVRQLLQMALIQ